MYGFAIRNATARSPAMDRPQRLPTFIDSSVLRPTRIEATHIRCSQSNRIAKERHLEREPGRVGHRKAKLINKPFAARLKLEAATVHPDLFESCSKLFEKCSACDLQQLPQGSDRMRRRDPKLSFLSGLGMFDRIPTET